jgi:uncharacterized protein YndB with AHSA1/START domain
MKFSTKEDIEAPIDQVFRMVTDFDRLERSALRRGAEVRRTDSLTAKGPGMKWSAVFKFRGKQRHVDLELLTYEPPHGMVCHAEASGLDAVVRLELVALSRRRTRMSLETELKPNTLTARLFVQSLKLARSKLNRRYHLRVAEYARELENQFNRRT